MARKNTIVTHTVRSGANAEQWTLRQRGHASKTIVKATVRVAKGQPGGGQFHGATNLRGTVVG